MNENAYNEAALAGAEALADAYEAAAERMARGLTEAAASGERAFEAMARSVTRSLASIAVERLLTVPLERAADTAARRIANSAAGRALDGLFAGLLGAAPGGVIPGKALGGPVHAGRSYLVGERGPELFTPPSAGRLGGFGAAPVTIHLHGAGDSADTRRRSERQIERALARSVRRGLER